MDALQNSLLAHIALPLVVIFIMAGMGLGLRVSDFREILAQPKAAAIGISVQIFIVPAAAFAIAVALNLSPEMAVGLVILASCASGTNSNIFTLLAHANVALSITLTVICGVIAVVTVPLLGNFAVGWFASNQAIHPVHLPILATIGELFAVSVLPVILGMWFRHAKPDTASKLQSFVGVLGVAVLLLLLIVILYEIRDQIVPLLVQGGPAAAALIITGIAVGLIAGNIAGLAHRDALAIAIEAGNKNATMGLMVTLTLLHSSTMSIPSAVYASLQFSFGLALVLYGRSRLSSNRKIDQSHDGAVEND